MGSWEQVDTESPTRPMPHEPGAGDAPGWADTDPTRFDSGTDPNLGGTGPIPAGAGPRPSGRRAWRPWCGRSLYCSRFLGSMFPLPDGRAGVDVLRDRKGAGEA